MSKPYRIGARRAHYGSFPESLTMRVRLPFQVFGKQSRPERTNVQGSEGPYEGMPH